jgi:lipocalin
LSRTETLPEETLNSILAEAKHRNFDVSKLIFN